MRLVTFTIDGGSPRLGALIAGDTQVLDLLAASATASRTSPAAFSSMQSLIEAGDRALDQARQLVEKAPQSACHAFAGVRLLAPLPRPEQIRDFVCFEEHLTRSYEAAIRIQARQSADPVAREQELRASGRYNIPKAWYRQPLYYKANRFAVVGTGVDIMWPSYSTIIDYELEFAAVIGRKVKDVARSNARDCLFGYTIFNDLSARDAQLHEMEGNLGPAKGKDFDGANVMGPCIVTADEMPDPYALTMIARVNGKEWSRGNSSTMHWRFEDLIEHVSRSETLYPGEILGSGTVGGGCGAELMRFLSPGDTIELEVEGIGRITNRIVSESLSQKMGVEIQASLPG